MCIRDSSEDGLPIGAGLDDLGKGLRSMTGTIFSTKEKGVRYLELTEGYINKLAVDANDEVIGYQFVKLGKMKMCIRDRLLCGHRSLCPERWGRAARGVLPHHGRICAQLQSVLSELRTGL